MVHGRRFIFLVNLFEVMGEHAERAAGGRAERWKKGKHLL